MSRFAIGDIHGCYKALKQCLERSKFNYEKDELIVLGDVCDGWPFVHQCFDELLKIKNMIYILGNHDDWALEWFDRDEMYRGTSGDIPESLWTSQGGRATLESYGAINGYDLSFDPTQAVMGKAHLDILKNAKLYHIVNNQIFVHGGIPEFDSVENCHRDFLMWDRDMLQRALNVHFVNPDFKINEFKDIFIGHTTTQWINNKIMFKTERRHIEKTSDEACMPLHLCNVRNLDTGAGWNGKLTIMNTDTYKFWQSDNVLKLYPDVKGRH